MNSDDMDGRKYSRLARGDDEKNATEYLANQDTTGEMIEVDITAVEWVKVREKYSKEGS